MKKLLLWLIAFYQRHISPAFPGKCRFRPTCSEYAVEAIRKHGALKGSLSLVVLNCSHHGVALQASNDIRNFHSISSHCRLPLQTKKETTKPQAHRLCPLAFRFSKSLRSILFSALPLYGKQQTNAVNRIHHSSMKVNANHASAQYFPQIPQ